MTPDRRCCAACANWHPDRHEPAGRWGATAGEALCECDRLGAAGVAGYSQGSGACLAFAPRLHDERPVPVQGVLL